ncbi:hypothetical protein [Halomarina litorea]|uniref:hypothetical protein n=1 Tax=Halomarina litorea TaxID=2961595 RepID=UPI0020C3AA03|nr:hypothetical protein [Halomarina sp. BCD28]
MELWFTVTRVATLVNLVVLGGLSYVWLRNYLRLRATFALGLLVFGGLLLVQNGFATYIYLVDPSTSRWYAGIPERYNIAIMVLTVLQTSALAALVRITLE